MHNNNNMVAQHPHYSHAALLLPVDTTARRSALSGARFDTFVRLRVFQDVRARDGEGPTAQRGTASASTASPRRQLFRYPCELSVEVGRRVCVGAVYLNS